MLRWIAASLLVCVAACATPIIGTPAAPDDPEAGTLTIGRRTAVPIRPDALLFTGKARYEWPDKRSYEGAFVDGKPEGHGVEILPSGERYEGIFHGGVRDGHGVLTLPDGGRYEGSFVQGLRGGTGRLESNEGNYEGDWAGDVPNGTGAFEYRDGSRYSGEWTAGRRQGYGRYEQPDGSYYDGEWAGDVPNGFGQMHETNGARYDGAWEGAQRTGYGLMETRAGVTYEGTWVADQREGFGRETRPDGTTYTGEWHAGARNGFGIVESLSGSRHEGNWEGGLPHGPGTRRSDEGVEITGMWNANAVSSGMLALPSGRSYAGALYDEQNERVDAALLAWLTHAAESGDAHAALLLGEAFSHFKDPTPDPAQAKRWYARAADAGLAEGRYQLAALELEAGDAARALALLEAAAEQRHAASAAQLGAFYQLGQHVEKSYSRALQYYEIALTRGHVVARNNLAWLLATCPDPALRDGGRAVKLIEPLAYFTEDWGYLDTLAAARAETGDYTAAIEAQQNAIGRIKAAAEADVAGLQELESRLTLYEQRKPYHEAEHARPAQEGGVPPPGKSP